MAKIKRIYYRGYEISWNPYFKKWQTPVHCELFGTIDMAKEAIDADRAEQEALDKIYEETTHYSSW